MKYLFTIAVALLPVLVLGQNGNHLQQFVPPNCNVFYSAKGDLNKDSLDDELLVVQHIDTLEVDEVKYVPREIIILFQDRDGRYNVVERNSKILTIGDLPPTYDDPFREISIKNGVIQIDQMFDYTLGNFFFLLIQV